MNIDRLKDFYDKRDVALVPYHNFYPYVTDMLALKYGGAKHRIIADYLNEEVVNAPHKVNNNTVSKMLKIWQQKGYITKHTEEEAAIKLELIKRDDFEGYKEKKEIREIDSVLGSIEVELGRKLTIEEMSMYEANKNNFSKEEFLSLLQ